MASSTPLHRLQATKVAFTSKYGLKISSRTTIAVWTIGLALLATLTVKDFVPLLKDYKENNVATRVEVILGDMNFTPPQLVIAIPVYKGENLKTEDLMQIARYLSNESLECEPCRKLEAVGWDVWKDGALEPYKDTSTIYGALSLTMVQKLFTLDPEDIFDEQNSWWNEPIFYAVMNFFQWQSDTDYFGPQKVSSDPKLAVWHSRIMLTEKAKLERLHQQMYRVFCRKMIFREYDPEDEFDPDKPPLNTTCFDLLLNRSLPVTLDYMPGLWLPLPRLDRPRIKRYRFTMLHSNSSQNSLWIPNPDARGKTYKIFPDTSIMYIAKGDPIYPSHLYQAPVERKRYDQIVSIRYGIQMRAKETRPGSTCRKEHSVKCSAKCTKSWTIEKCGCVPFLHRVGLEYDPATPFCNFTHYASCHVLLMSPEDRNRCVDRCKNSCEYTSYNWYISYESTETEFILELFPIFSAFTELSWTIKKYRRAVRFSNGRHNQFVFGL